MNQDDKLREILTKCGEVEWVSIGEDYVEIDIDHRSCNSWETPSLWIEKQEVIALAKHFKLTEEDLKW